MTFFSRFLNKTTTYVKLRKEWNAHSTAGPSGRELLRATGESLGGAGAAQEGLPKDKHHTLTHLIRNHFDLR